MHNSSNLAQVIVVKKSSPSIKESASMVFKVEADKILLALLA